MTQIKETLLYYEDLKKIIPHVNRTTLWRWMRAGRFPKSRYCGPRRKCWLASDIQNWLDSLSSKKKDSDLD